MLVVVVVTVVATVLLTRDRSSDSPPTAASLPSTSVDTSDIASADDRGPVGIILEDPTCAAWEPIAQTLADQERRDGWDRRNPSIPASAWDTTERAQYEAVGAAMRSAADETTQLIKLTPHRVMRELYEQVSAYWRYFEANVQSYMPDDDHVLAVAHGLAGTLNWICAAITYGSAAARSPFTTDGVPPLSFSPTGDPSNPERFLTQPSPVCAKWQSMVDDYRAATFDWINGVDPNLPAGHWPPEQQRLFSNVFTVIGENGGQVQNLGIESANPIWRDFAVLASQYRQAYAQAIPSYIPADNYLDSAASELIVVIDEACTAVAG